MALHSAKMEWAMKNRVNPYLVKMRKINEDRLPYANIGKRRSQSLDDTFPPIHGLDIHNEYKHVDRMHNNSLARQRNIERQIDNLKAEEPERFRESTFDKQRDLLLRGIKNNEKQFSIQQNVLHNHYINEKICERRNKYRINNKSYNNFLPPHRPNEIDGASPNLHEKRLLPNDTKDRLREGCYMNKKIIYDIHMSPHDARKEIKKVYDNHSTQFNIITGH